MTYNDQKYNDLPVTPVTPVTPEVFSPSRISMTRKGSSTTTGETEPGVQSSIIDYEAIASAYCENIGDLKAPVAHFIETLLQKGMKADVIIEAIQATGWAAKPSPQYLRKILNRYLMCGIFTVDDVMLDNNRFEDAKPKWWERYNHH